MTLSKKDTGGLGPKRERFAPEYGVWFEVIEPLFDSKSNDWFKDFNLTPLRNYLQNRGESSSSMGLIEHWLEEFFEPEELLVPDEFILNNVELFGPTVELDKSELGKKVIKALTAAGLSWRFAPFPKNEDEPGFPSHWNEEEIPQDDKTKIEIFYQGDEEFAFLQYVRIHKDKRGNETAIWYAPQLVASRPMRQITEWYVNNSKSGRLEFDVIPPSDLGKVMNIGEWSEQIAIPILFKKLFFVAEAGLPATSSKPGDRVKNFPAAKSGGLPKPVLFYDLDSHVGGTWASDEGNQIYSLEAFPHVANQGWIFSDATPASLAKTFKSFSEGLKRVQFVLANAFSGGFTQNFNGSWDRYTLSAMLMVAQEQRAIVNGAGYWHPTLTCALKSAETRGQYFSAREKETEDDTRRSTMISLSNTGIGAAVPAAINTLVFSDLVRENQFELSVRLLELASLMSVPREAWNAVNNWGITLFVSNEIAAAEEKFLQVLASSEVTAHSEAHAYLAAIARLRDDSALAKKHDELCEKTGGYNAPIFAQAENDIPKDEFSFDFDYVDEPDDSGEPVRLPKNSRSGLSLDVPDSDLKSGTSLARFCGECGTAYTLDEQKFCGSCGTKRS